MGLSDVQEIYHKRFCAPWSRRLSGAHKLEWQIFVHHEGTLYHHLNLHQQKTNVLIFVWRNVNKETFLSMLVIFDLYAVSRYNCKFDWGLRKQPGPDEGRISSPKFFFFFALYQILVNFYDL